MRRASGDARFFYHPIWYDVYAGGRKIASGWQKRTVRSDMEAEHLGETFYRDLDELQGAIWYARFAQAAAERNG